MKLIVPKDFSGAILDAQGTICQPVNGIVEIPDSLVHSALWGQGFIVLPEVEPSQAPVTNNQDAE
jgi:hypothetical protein